MSPTTKSPAVPPIVPEITVRDRKHYDATFLQLDPSTCDPNRHYRWVRIDTHNSSSVRHKLRGYKSETLNTEGGVRTLAEPDGKGNSAIVIGDLMLMSCPREEYERRMMERHQRTEMLLHSTSAETERRAKEKGITLIQDPDHFKETR